MTQILFAQRSMYQDYQRCHRLRWLENYEGEQGIGLVPKRKSLHLVVGGAVHAGMEVLLREGQAWLDKIGSDLIIEVVGADGPQPATLEYQLDVMFGKRMIDPGITTARLIEDRAVAAALEDLRQEFGQGVELDPEEAAAQQAKQPDGLTASPQIDMGGLRPGQSSNTLQEDSPIVISFDGLDGLTPLTADDHVPPLTQPVYKSQSSEDYLREELSALTEGMVRAWARRRWRGLLEQFEVLEVEREGEWTLARWDGPMFRHDFPLKGELMEGQTCTRCGLTYKRYETPEECPADSREIHFLSRHDALLLERQTGYLYLQSFKTTGTWDRRKEMDAQVDMQGLSEAVDVERRFHEAHGLLAFMSGVEAAVKRNTTPTCPNCGARESAHQKEFCLDCKCGETFAVPDPIASLADNPEYLDSQQRVKELVSDRVAEWLRGLPDPPQILGDRYEYLLKGMRKKDKKDAMNPDRYVQESILCRAYKQEGITSDDRRWAWTYDWQDEAGKGRRLDYRSWQKAAVWKFMSIADWIDLLDAGKVQEGALNEQGEAMDALGEQFVPVLTVYRNSDEMLDLLEQMESQEVQIAKDVAEVRRAEREEGYAGKRTALNRLFPQNRQSCSYPGLCSMRSTPTQPGFCFGSPDPFHDQTVLERFQAREPNHPKEGLVQIECKS